MKRIFIIAENYGKSTLNTTLSLLDIAYTVGKNIDAKPTVVIFSDNDKSAKDLSEYASEVILFSSEEYLDYNYNFVMQGLKSVIKTNDTTIVLSASDFLSEDFCGGLSAYLDCPYFPNCVSLQTDNSGISVIKPIYNSSVYEQLSITKFPAIISLSSIAPYSETLKKRKGRIKAITIENTEKKYTTFEEKILKSSIKQPVKSNIIGGGTAFVNKTEFQKLIIPFAKYLDADIVISKELYEKDNNWEYKTVGAPEGFIKSNAYFAVGINGHDNHLNAVTESKLIIAINDDPNSPIFKNADIGIIADIKKFIPVFTEILRRRNI